MFASRSMSVATAGAGASRTRELFGGTKIMTSSLSSDASSSVLRDSARRTLSKGEAAKLSASQSLLLSVSDRELQLQCCSCSCRSEAPM